MESIFLVVHTFHWMTKVSGRSLWKHLPENQKGVWKFSKNNLLQSPKTISLKNRSSIYFFYLFSQHSLFIFACVLWCRIIHSLKLFLDVSFFPTLFLYRHIIYYTSKCEMWQDIYQVEGEWYVSQYLMQNECNKWFILYWWERRPRSRALDNNSDISRNISC